MKFARLGALTGLIAVIAIEVTRRTTLQVMEGEGSALWTMLAYWVSGFPLSVFTYPLLEGANETLQVLPGPAAYVLLLLIAFVNWVIVGLLVDAWRRRKHRESLSQPPNRP